MITEDYVSFETAKLLREKGFNEICEMFYCKPHEGYLKNHKRDEWWNSNLRKDMTCTCPTLQMAVKWLRKTHQLEVRSTYDYDKDSWWGNINPMFEETDENSDIYQKALGFDYQGKSYEESAEAAVKYCLENLI